MDCVFDFTINKHGMSSTDINDQLKKLDTILAMEKNSESYLMVFWIRRRKRCEVKVVEFEELVLKKIVPELKPLNWLFAIVFKPRELKNDFVFQQSSYDWHSNRERYCW